MPDLTTETERVLVGLHRVAWARLVALAGNCGWACAACPRLTECDRLYASVAAIEAEVRRRKAARSE